MRRAHGWRIPIELGDRFPVGQLGANFEFVVIEEGERASESCQKWAPLIMRSLRPEHTQTSGRANKCKARGERACTWRRSEAPPSARKRRPHSLLCCSQDGVESGQLEGRTNRQKRKRVWAKIELVPVELARIGLDQKGASERGAQTNQTTKDRKKTMNSLGQSIKSEHFRSFRFGGQKMGTSSKWAH